MRCCAHESCSLDRLPNDAGGAGGMRADGGIGSQSSHQQTVRKEAADAMDTSRRAPLATDSNQALNGGLEDTFRRWYPAFRSKTEAKAA
jgi:hypothetical protein